MAKIDFKEYDVYYDESKEPGYWHGLLFIPCEKARDLSKLLEDARQNIGGKDRAHFVNIKKASVEHDLHSRLVRSFVSIGVASLQQCKFIKFPSQAYVGNNITEMNPIGSKFSIYCVSNETMISSLDRTELIMQTMKSTLKGSLHYLFDQRDQIRLRRIIFEGKNNQGVDHRKIIRILKAEIASNIEIQSEVFEFVSSDQNTVSPEYFSEAHILQCMDCMLGSMRHAHLAIEGNSIRDEISQPMRSILREYNDATYVRMKQSRYFRGFSFSRARKDGSLWNFETLAEKKIMAPAHPKLPL